jgi:hypothetical protein
VDADEVEVEVEARAQQAGSVGRCSGCATCCAIVAQLLAVQLRSIPLEARAAVIEKARALAELPSELEP